jgi:hypothetical protein
MSMSGQQRLELEQARLEQVRLAAVRAECAAILDACEMTLREVRDVATQQLAAAGLRDVAATLSSARASMADRPDDALQTLTGAVELIHTTLTSAEAQARAWSEAQTQAVARSRVAVTCALAVEAGLGGVKSASGEARAALQAAERGDLGASEALRHSAAVGLDGARASALEERVRREVVKGLLKTLQEMGFVTVGPQLDAGVVTLEGRLASGRRARFEVSLEGRMSFDLDGYEGRACADDLEKVEVSLRDRFGVKLGPPQVIWKNPDRLSQGARDIPGGATRKRG